MKYPCNGCEKEQWPGCCDNKGCASWRSWFMEKWAYTRGLWGAGHETP